MPESPTRSNGDAIPLGNIAQFLKHHLHDVRNDLNALNLEAALLGMLVTDPEASASAQRIQDHLHQCAARLGTLSAKISEPTPSADVVPAQFILTSWRDDLNAYSPATVMTWAPSKLDSTILVDVRQLTEVFRELVSNLKTHGCNAATVELVEAGGGGVVYRIIEVKKDAVDPSQWGSVPFAQPRRASYGLGLWRSRRIVEANNGIWSQQYLRDPSSLVTELRFPQSN